MTSASLDFSWRVRVIVTPDDLDGLTAALDFVSRHSLCADLAVLACADPAVQEALQQCPLSVEYVLPSVVQEDCFWTTVCAAAGRIDRTLFLRATVLVPQCWDARLAAVGQRLPDVAAVAPLCARHVATSVFTSTSHSPGLDVEAMDQWLGDYTTGSEFSLPVLPQNCLLMQGGHWDAIPAAIANDRELKAWLQQQGASVVASTQIYVDDSALACDQDTGFLPQALSGAILHRSPLAPLRHALTELSARAEQPPVMRNCLPVQLHVGHSWGGGLGRWMEDCIAADKAHNHLVLRSIGDLTGFGLTIGLYHSMSMESPVRTWSLSEPILSLSLGSHEYRKIIAELVDVYHVESLVISSLIGHSLDLLKTALPTTVVLHDFFPYCPALYATFGSPCQSCSAERLGDCAQDNPQHAYFKFETDAHWLAARSTYLDLVSGSHVTLVAPSESVVTRYRQLVPEWANRAIHVIPHGLSIELVEALVPSDAESEPSERLKVVVTGRLTPEKGADILEQVIESAQSFADFHLLGTGDSGKRFEGRRGVTVMRTYHQQELGQLLSTLAPDVAMLLSVVPETFSYTLSELQAAEIPVIATRVGAFTERIHSGESGWLVEPDPVAVMALLETLDADRVGLSAVREVLAAQSVRTTEEMAQDYARLQPEARPVPLHRYDLPRRTYCNPYAAERDTGSEALIVGHQVPYRRVLVEFLHYSAGKVSNSPRLAVVLGRPLAAALRGLARWLSP